MDHPILSPITGILNEENVVLDYGEHEGKTVKEIQEIDPDFYDALIDQKGSGIYAIKREAYLDGNKTFRLYLNPLAQMDQ
jgi:hypothetical protein